MVVPRHDSFMGVRLLADRYGESHMFTVRANQPNCLLRSQDPPFQTKPHTLQRRYCSAVKRYLQLCKRIDPRLTSGACTPCPLPVGSAAPCRLRSRHPVAVPRGPKGTRASSVHCATISPPDLISPCGKRHTKHSCTSCRPERLRRQQGPTAAPPSHSAADSNCSSRR